MPANYTKTAAEIADTIAPYVGMPCTFGIGSDRYAMKVTKIERNGRTIVAETPGGGLRRRFTLRRTGRFVSEGQSFGSLGLGHAEDYRDPSF